MIRWKISTVEKTEIGATMKHVHVHVGLHLQHLRETGQKKMYGRVLHLASGTIQVSAVSSSLNAEVNTQMYSNVLKFTQMYLE